MDPDYCLKLFANFFLYPSIYFFCSDFESTGQRFVESALGSLHCC